jgi:hypothetical protein
MSNVHRGDGESYCCPDKGNRFPLRVYQQTAGRFVDERSCPGCGADLKTHYVREESSPAVEAQPSMTPAPAPAIKEPPAVRQAGMPSRRSRR